MTGTYLYPNHIIKMGTLDAANVMLIKARLDELGYQLDKNNSNFGDTTDQTVRAFQKDNALTTDGIVGKLTWDKLFGQSTVDIVPGTETTLSQMAVSIARGELSVREKTGHNDGAQVEAFLASVGLSKGNPWCMAFVYWCFQQASYKLGVTSPVPKTGSVVNCLELAYKSGITIIHTNPRIGDQGILDFGGGKGHTFLVEKYHLENDHVYTVEGNTNDQGGRDGNGVFERDRDVNKVKAFIRY